VSCDKSADVDGDVAGLCWDGEPFKYWNLPPVCRSAGLDGQMNDKVGCYGVLYEGDVASTAQKGEVALPSYSDLEINRSRRSGTESSSLRIVVIPLSDLGGVGKAVPFGQFRRMYPGSPHR